MTRTTLGTSLRATFVALTASALAVSAIAPATAGPVKDQKQAARWLAGQTTDGVVYNDQFDFNDYGLTVDLGLALVELDRQQSTLAQVADALADGAASYTTGVDFGSEDVYAGATAKLATFAVRVGEDPASFGGLDLVAQLEDRVVTEGPSTGRIQDASEFGDFANTLGQAYAVEALDAAGSELADEALDFLLAQQCDAGFFRLGFTTDTQASDQTCEGGVASGDSAADTDATAIALLGLLSLDRTRPVRRALDQASDWLIGAQKANGSLGGGPSTEASNTNSTGLASWALGELGACTSAREAAQWVKGLQVGAANDTGLAAERGAIAYDRTAWRAGKDEGITEESRDQWRRATTQAAPALLNPRKASCGR